MLVKIHINPGDIRTDAILDTGFSGDLVIPEELAMTAGIDLAPPVDLPRTFTKVPIDGISGRAYVSFVGCRAGAHVEVFCPHPKYDVNAVVVGEQLLRAVGAAIQIGRRIFDIRSARRNRARRPEGPIDLGHVVIPIDLPNRWQDASSPPKRRR